MAESKSSPRHEMSIFNRNAVHLSGVLNVESFDSEEFLLETECGYLAIRGQNLFMKNMSLESGEVSIEGTIYDLSYMEGDSSDRGKGLFGRLFK